MNPELIAPTIFEFFRNSFRRNLLADEMNELYEKLHYMTGASVIPGSKFYKDPFTESAVKAAAKYTLRLKPS